jgi:excisionase family DNA binding protein
MAKRKCRKTKQVSADVLDIHEAGWLLGAHVETVRRLARRGGLPAYKVGKDWRFSKKALTRWMETHHMRQRDPLILVIDDEKDVRERVASFVAKDGYRVAVAENGNQTAEAMRRELPDVAILSFTMPDGHSAYVLKALHSIKPDLPVILVTGYPDSKLIADALRYPPVTLLPKPVDNKVLLETVRRLLHGAIRID